MDAVCDTRMSYWAKDYGQLQCAIDILEVQDTVYEVREDDKGRFAIFVPADQATHAGMDDQEG